MRRVLYIVSVILVTALFGACGTSGIGPSTPTNEPVSIEYINGQTGVSTDASFQKTFNRPVESGTVSQTTYFIVEAIYGCDPNRAVISNVILQQAIFATASPQSPLRCNTSYMVCLTSRIRYLDGDGYPGFSATFTTESCECSTSGDCASNAYCYFGECEISTSVGFTDDECVNDSDCESDDYICLSGLNSRDCSTGTCIMYDTYINAGAPDSSTCESEGYTWLSNIGDSGICVAGDYDQCQGEDGGDNNLSDFDGDGVTDSEDNCTNVSNADQADADGDGTGDACELDTDGDGVIDDDDNCPTTINANQTNSDSDSYGDVCDNCPTTTNEDQDATDTDGDGTVDTCDNCVSVANASQANTDTDSFGDACDVCPEIADAAQTDTDDDGIGDACEIACADLAGGYGENTSIYPHEGSQTALDLVSADHESKLVDTIYLTVTGCADVDQDPFVVELRDGGAGGNVMWTANCTYDNDQAGETAWMNCWNNQPDLGNIDFATNVTGVEFDVSIWYRGVSGDGSPPYDEYRPLIGIDNIDRTFLGVPDTSVDLILYLLHD